MPIWSFVIVLCGLQVSKSLKTCNQRQQNETFDALNFLHKFRVYWCFTASLMKMKFDEPGDINQPRTRRDNQE